MTKLDKLQAALFDAVQQPLDESEALMATKAAISLIIVLLTKPSIDSIKLPPEFEGLRGESGWVGQNTMLLTHLGLMFPKLSTQDRITLMMLTIKDL